MSESRLRVATVRPPWTPSRPSSSASSRGSPSSCRSRAPRTCGSSPPSWAGRTPARRSPPSSSSGRWPRCSSTSATDLWRIARDLVREPARPGAARATLDARMGWYIGLGTIPIAIFGLIFNDQIESGARDLYLIGTTLIVLGLVLLLRRAGGQARAATLERRSTRARRGAHRLRAGAGADPGRLALGRDDHRRPVPRLRPRRRPPATRSCSRSPPSCSPACSSCARSASAGGAGAVADR